tara:strand:+ start:122 stop:337 length:216 start_codon:yes stop_codon:yes gene_type:complete
MESSSQSKTTHQQQNQSVQLTKSNQMETLIKIILVLLLPITIPIGIIYHLKEFINIINTQAKEIKREIEQG